MLCAPDLPVWLRRQCRNAPVEIAFASCGLPAMKLLVYGRRMTCASVTTARVVLPSFGRARTCPEIPTELYRTRLSRTVERMRAAKLDALVVYADREHCANVAYLTGFDPRFEESLLLLSSEGRRKLLVGNECLGYLPDTQALALEVELFQISAWARLNVSGVSAGSILTSICFREARRRSMCRPILPTSCANWRAIRSAS
jgi:hypothetical protein